MFPVHWGVGKSIIPSHSLNGLFYIKLFLQPHMSDFPKMGTLMKNSNTSFSLLFF